MALVPFGELMADAARYHYAVGYFESWNLESLLAVADAAEAVSSPVLLGVSGIYLPHPARLTREHLSDYAALGLAIARRVSVPACLVFNETPHSDWVSEAVRLGFGLVMYTDESLSYPELVARVRTLTAEAHAAGRAVEGELVALPGVAGALDAAPANLRLTDPLAAREFVAATSVDALAVNVGQAHLHGRRPVRLDLDRLTALRASVDVPLVLHGATSVARDDLAAAIRAGVRKINVGSALKQSYFEALRRACAAVDVEYNPYAVLGSGFPDDVLTIARLALQKTVEDLMCLFGSAGHAPTVNRALAWSEP